MNQHGTNRFTRAEPASLVEIIIYFFFTIFATFRLITGEPVQHGVNRFTPLKFEYFRKCIELSGFSENLLCILILCAFLS